MQTFKIELQVVSPLHIGTGEVYEPTEFFLDPSRRELCIIDFEKFCAHFSASELQKFKKICFAGTLQSLLNLYAFVDQTCLNFLNQGLSDFIVRRIELCEGFLEHYRRVQSLTGKQLEKEFNKFSIYRTAYSPNDNQPIIPGSSVKGALRTAVLNKRRHKVQGKSYQDYCRQNRRGRIKCEAKKLEQEILNYENFKNDPFRLIKVSDFRPKGPVKTRIVYAVNRKKDGTSARGPYQILEVIEPGAIFEGEITIHDPPPRIKTKDSRKTCLISAPVSFEELIQAAKAFYGGERDREFEDLSKMGASVPLFPEEGTPLRVGRNSGAECVTIEGFRHILIRGKGKNTYQDHATTLWLAGEFFNVHNPSGLKPFGWVVFHKPDAKGSKSSGKTSSTKETKPGLDVSKLGKRFKLVVKKK